jgi:hypothetical protein
MEIKYFDAFLKGWERMKQSLFSKPFNIDKWFAVGFTAFLANLMSGGSTGSGSNSFREKYNMGHFDFSEVFNFPDTAYDWLSTHQFWFWLVITGIIFVFTIIILFTWLSSRGHFMFLHNVVNNNSEVKKPWNEYKKEGDSLFLWRIVFGIIVFFLAITIVVYGFIFAKNTYFGNTTFSDKIVAFISLVIIFGIISIITAYISLFLKDFIVPVMYKHRLTTTQAWNFFLPTLKSNLFQFLLYGIFILFLWLVTIAVIVVLGLATCCIGFLLLAIPYIGTVLLLPVYYTFRALSVEFLEQFGDDYKLFPEEETFGEEDTALQ